MNQLGIWSQNSDKCILKLPKPKVTSFKELFCLTKGAIEVLYYMKLEPLMIN